MPFRMAGRVKDSSRLALLHGTLRQQGYQISVPHGTHSSCVPPSLAAIDRILNPPKKR